MKLIPYLYFDGQCREALQFYEKALGAKVTFVQAIGDSPMARDMPPESHDRIMHATLRLGDQFLHGADTLPGSEHAPPTGFSLVLNFDNTDQAQRVFAALAEEGQVLMPFQPTFWAKGFGMVTDRFGTPWKINVGESAGA